MSPTSSDPGGSGGTRPKNVRSSGLELRSTEQPALDDIDRLLVSELSADARMPNNALAKRAGIAPSTCLARVTRLRQIGVIRGFHADIDPSLTGRPIQALVAVRIQGTGRTRLNELQAYLVRQPGVLDVYLLGGAHDFMVHVAAPSTDSLNDFVTKHLSGNADIAHTETNLIFRHGRSQRYH
ncbi:MAG: Lrp/AsnC family transcriptional regulator [Nocardioides sp.]|uniref:Lrp/AsnC family transcriptional regulator n=1 Tax=Nocardioides sp. TaxID=35761 RepID=UPI0039E24118